MILYHGTNIDFSEIDLSKSKPNKDFGKGFYLSANYGQAMEMAKIKYAQNKKGVVRVFTYEFDESCLESDDFKILRFETYSNEWADFILKNRTNSSNTNIHDYDVVYGPIADDRVGAQIRLYEDGLINIEMLVNNLKFMKGMTMQYIFCTEKSIKYLKRL